MDQPEESKKDISILVIDDDPGVRGVLTTYLADEGYDVAAESCGEAGVLALEDRSFDVVITDLKMPGMNGLDVLRHVKERSPDSEVIVITGYATIQSGVEAMREGAYDFLIKPVKVAQIDGVLDRCIRWLQHKRSHAELEAVNRKLLELTAMKERFLAVADHELRTPVTVLDGMLQLLRRQGSELPDAVRTRVDSLCQVSGRLVQMVRDIHDLVQSRSESFPISQSWTTVERLEEGVQLDFDMARFNRDLNFELSNHVPADFSFQADVHRLSQAITELIQNAVKATPDGGRVQVQIALQQEQEGHRLKVLVSDTGVGVPPEEQQRILELFHGVGNQLHHHTSKYEFLGSGLGIGLTIVLEIAKAHGGGLELSSRPDKGSQFTLWLPTQ